MGLVENRPAFEEDVCQREKERAHEAWQSLQVQEVVEQSDVVEADQVHDEVGECESVEHIENISDDLAHKFGSRKNGLDES